MIYLVDYENTKQAGLEGIESLDREDLLILFTSPACGKNLDRSVFSNCMAFTKFVECVPNGAKNYMDFQIVAAAARYIAEGKEVCIVSADGGYKAVRDFFKGNSLFPETCTVQLRECLSGKQSKSKKAEKEAKVKPVVIESTKSSEPDEPVPDMDMNKQLQEILKKVNCKNDLKSQLCAKFGKEMGKQLYAKYESCYPEKKPKKKKKAA